MKTYYAACSNNLDSLRNNAPAVSFCAVHTLYCIIHEMIPLKVL